MADENKFKMMTEQLRLVHSDEDVANYIRWIGKAIQEDSMPVVLGRKRVIDEMQADYSVTIQHTLRNRFVLEVTILNGGMLETGKEFQDDFSQFLKKHSA